MCGIARLKRLKWRFWLELAGRCFNEQVDDEPVPLGIDPVIAVDGVGSNPWLPESVTVGEDTPVDVGVGAGVPTSVPEGNGGMLDIPWTICWLVPARLATGPPGKV